MTYAIVAIPRSTDMVWQVSSEKVPHLTLLVLGEKLDNLEAVTRHIQHSVETMLSRFYLIAEDRQILGNKNADVLMFNQSKVSKSILGDFRQSLLGQTDIAAAYRTTEQFPEWRPHLTLGYPDSPAKQRDESYIVEFDRIALWTGDYEGVEFPLKTNEADLSMAEVGKAYLEHYGVKGMKWGVIRDRGVDAVKTAYKPSNDAVRAQKYMTRAKLGGVRNLDNREMQLVINRMNLERQYKELYGERQWHNAGKKWVKNFLDDVARDVTKSWLRNPFAGPTTGNNAPIRTEAWIEPSRRRAISA